MMFKIHKCTIKRVCLNNNKVTKIKPIILQIYSFYNKSHTNITQNNATLTEQSP